ncbi:YcaO-like family protein [Embleya sp. NPDC020886]|uniref:YcaO-like family protein n=1 Tax=Embleya sp. NPDC020886 TaxID=3363980 RepID=UPI0037992E21
MFSPYDSDPDTVFARIAARSPHFDAVDASGGRPILVGSAAGHDRERVAASARGELLERVGNILAGRAAEADASMIGTYAELCRKGVPALDPAGDDPAPARPPHSAPTARETRRLWVRGHRFDSGEETYLPADAVFLHHRPPTGCDPGPRAGSTGVASHPDPTSAAEHAAWEVLERDLVRRSWYGLDPPPVRLLPAGPPEPLAKLLPELGVLATTLDLAAPDGARCVVVCLHAPDGTRQSFGARCGPEADLPTLIEKAAYEALMVRWSMDTAVARATWERWRGGSPPETAVQHALWAYHVQDSLSSWTTRSTRQNVPPSEAGPFEEGTAHPPGSTPSVVPSGLDALSAHTGREIVLVDTTAGPAHALGATVIRVVAPGAAGLPAGPDDAHRRTATTPRGPHPFG